MLISKLRPKDSFGLATFDTKGYTILEPTFKENIGQSVYSIIGAIICQGGTTIRSGFELSKNLLKEFIKKNQLTNCQNRIIMLTDVCDNSMENEKSLIQAASIEDGIGFTVIGISSQFRSEVCQKLKNMKGFNYFCAVNQEDLNKYLFQTFDFGFFVSANDLSIAILSNDISRVQVFGTPDSDQVALYNDKFSTQSTTFIISKLKSVFPSELEIHQEKLYTIGGLILVKLKRKSQNPFFKGQISLSYSEPNGKFREQSYKVGYEFHATEQFIIEQSLRSALEAYTFTSELRFLINASKGITESQVYEKYQEILLQLNPSSESPRQKITRTCGRQFRALNLNNDSLK